MISLYLGISYIYMNIYMIFSYLCFIFFHSGRKGKKQAFHMLSLFLPSSKCSHTISPSQCLPTPSSQVSQLKALATSLSSSRQAPHKNSSTSHHLSCNPAGPVWIATISTCQVSLVLPSPFDPFLSTETQVPSKASPILASTSLVIDP